MMTLSDDLRGWLAASTEGIDLGRIPAAEVLPRLAGEGLSRIGVPEALGGSGGDGADAVNAVTAVASESLAAAFIPIVTPSIVQLRTALAATQAAA